ncbi:MAG: 5-formyltetrahydrofolate cyclo-ligase [Prevotella sp.]
MLKAELREQMRRKKKSYTSGQLAEMSDDIVQKLLAHPRISKARTVMMYASLPDEVNTHGLMDKLVGMGKKVLLPVVIGPGNMELRLYSGSSELQEGMFHIMEPVGSRVDTYGDIDVAVIPGMAFDVHGNRLGRGKGFYDRFLCLLCPSTYKIGVCFRFQKTDAVPVECTDVPVDEVLTND